MESLSSLIANVASRGAGGWVAAALAFLILSSFVGYAGVSLVASVVRAGREWWAAVSALRRASAARDAARIAHERLVRRQLSSEAYLLLRHARREAADERR